jgi:RNase H-like domain found in reverse transcriptase
VSGSGESPICFFSQKLSRAQMAWSVVEREAYAVIASLNKFHHLLFGSEIVVFSDHSPLSFLVDCATKSSKLTRWSLALQQYNIVFKYAKASQNTVADYFSRVVVG